MADDNPTGFPPGHHHVLDGQRYWPIRRRPYVNKLGEAMALVDWESDCPDCGVAFVVSTRFSETPTRRRCGDCKNPRMVNPTKRKLWRQRYAIAQARRV